VKTENESELQIRQADAATNEISEPAVEKEIADTIIYEILLRTCDGTFEQNAPGVKISDAQKKETAELDSKYAGKNCPSARLRWKTESRRAASDFEKNNHLREQLIPTGTAKTFKPRWKREEQIRPPK